MTDFRRPEPITSKHEVAEFDCGSDAQNVWLKEYAPQASRAGSSQVYVSCASRTNRVAGYYALAAGSVEPKSAPERVTQGLGRYPTPVVLLTRLGVDTQFQGLGLGLSLVADALLQTASVADQIGVRALLVHAESATARDFNLWFSSAFAQSPTDELHLLLLMKDLRAAVREAAAELASES